jgi:hypothetical protein
MAFLTRQLGSAKDARARAQAAVMLGAAHEPSVAPALCTALADESALVRLAVVRSLEKLLGHTAQECLSRHPTDADPSVQAERDRVLALLSGSQGAPPASFYVALTATSELRGADSARTLQLTQGELEQELRQKGGVVAGDGDPSHALSKMRKGRLKGYRVRVKLTADAPGGLTLDVTCFTDPNDALLGEVSVSASGASTGALVKALVPKVLEEATETCNWSH